MDSDTTMYFIFCAMTCWLAYQVWRILWPVSDSVFRSGSSKVHSGLPSAPSPAIQLPRLYPIFPVDGSKGDTTVDIIAVHGIETTSPKTWTAFEHNTESKGRPVYWLKDADMLPSVVQNARIWVFDYNSNYSDNAQTVRVDGLATTLLNYIQDIYDEFRSRKIVFIGSCFGGIVVAEALLTASHDLGTKKSVFEQTAGVIFLGSPLRGTKAATFARWKNLVSGIMDPNQESSCTLLNDLEANSSRLEKLVADFAKLTVQNRTQARMEIRCFYETQKTQVFNAINGNLRCKPQKILLVDKVSACLDCHEHIPLNARHAMMNKYRGPEDPSFKLVAGRIKEIVDKISTNPSLTPEERKCMQTLSFPYQDHKDMNPGRVEGTCEWLLNHSKFLAWRKETTANLLWVTAGPGCGKSVLSKALVDEGLLHPTNPDTKMTSICYFFFKDDAERGSGDNALRSILHQLFRQKPWLIRYATLEYEHNGSKLPFRTLWDILIKAVADTSAGPVVCMFDALDECEPSRRKSLMNYISDFYRVSNTTSPKLKFVLTSRPYHELQMGFDVSNLPAIHLEGNEVSDQIAQEVDLVISSEIARISNARQPPFDDEVQASLIQHLKKYNNRTYLWVYLMLQEISRSLESTKSKLIRLVGQIPRSIEDIYEQILKRATNQSMARRVLHLILAAERPLTWKEMNVALEILDMKDSGKECTSERDLDLEKKEAFQKKIGNLCGLFVSIVDGKLYLIHQTAKEFLINNNSNADHTSPLCWKHTFTPESSHLEVLKACLWFLQLEFRGLAIDSLDGTQFSQLENDHPLLLYASIHWTFHFRQAEKKADKDLAHNALHLCNTTSQSSPLWFQIYLRSDHNHVPEYTSSNLKLVCYLGLTTAVQLLVERNPDFDAEDKDRQTPLFCAAYNGHEAVVKLLLDTGKFDVDAKDKDRRTPLHYAASDGHEVVVKLLLDTDKVDVDAKDRFGWTPLSRAANSGHEAVVKLLLDTGKVDVDAKSEDRRTPLHYAAWFGREAVVKLLLDTGKVDVDAKDRFGWTPLSRAAKNEHEAVVKLLQTHLNPS